MSMQLQTRPDPRQRFDVLTIGHSNLAANDLIELLRRAGVTDVADVRSQPHSRRFPWFSARPLARRLTGEHINYHGLGDALGGRPHDPALYRDRIVDYVAMASTHTFQCGLDRVKNLTQGAQLCLLCAEREPLDCHRCLLVGRALAEQGLTVGHILPSGMIEPHLATEERLLATADENADLFMDRSARLAEAYRRRTRRVAARLTS
jgi:uncharacterized protein (DUF488 family)